MAGIISSIKNRIQINNLNKERDSVIKNRVADIGEIVEEEDRIICYVKQDLLINQCKYSADNILCIDGFLKDLKHWIDYLNKLNLNKPIYYIFDGIIFDWWLRFTSIGDCNIIFKNCTFRKGILIKKANNVSFENNKYYYSSNYFGFGDYFEVNNIKKLTFINENFINEAICMLPNRFGINIKADIVKIINSNIDCDRFGDMNIRANKLIVKDSNIDARRLKMSVNKLVYFNSNIKAKNEVYIDNKNKDYIGYINTPIVYYNGEKIVPINGFLKDVSEIELLNNARSELVLQLYQISMLCKKIEDRKIENVRRTLDEQPIGVVAIDDDFVSKYKEELLQQTRIELIKKLSDIRDYYQSLSDDKIDNIKNNFGNLSISRVLKRDDLGF